MNLLFYNIADAQYIYMMYTALVDLKIINYKQWYSDRGAFEFRMNKEGYSNYNDWR